MVEITEKVNHWHGGVTATLLFTGGILIKKTFDTVEQFDSFVAHFVNKK